MKVEEPLACLETHAADLALTGAVVGPEERDAHLGAVAIRIASHDGTGSDRLWDRSLRILGCG